MIQYAQHPLDNCKEILRTTFGYSGFRGQQQAVVEHLTTGGSAIVLMPTGGGKSLCYQVPAIHFAQTRGGVTIVVSPLIALMHDQVSALKEVGVKAAYLNSSLSAEEATRIERAMLAGELTLLYAAPERVNTPRFLGAMHALHERGALALFAIDEAHCVSQWGHDFRPEYQSLSVLHERYPDVPCIALTATADDHTRADISARLNLGDARWFIDSFDRPNIRYTIAEKTDPRRQLLKFLRNEHQGEAGIVYCQSRKKVEEFAEWLSTEGFNALPYHAGLDVAVRQRNQDRFLREDAVVMTATIAFGMGIDKPDVRFVAHVDLPRNIEGYYQETGRAGRDGEPADAWMCFGLQDVVQQRRMLDESPAAEDFKRIQSGKLDALLTLAEAHDCRRVRLLAYFGQTSTACGNCDNCLNPPEVWDASEAAQMLLSAMVRTGQRFGAAHLMDVVRGKLTDKVKQFNHESLNVFGKGASFSEAQLRSTLRQLVALEFVWVDAEAYNGLKLHDSARAVLKGERRVLLREAAEKEPKAARSRKTAIATKSIANEAMDTLSTSIFTNLKAWRAAVATEHNIPAYIIFHDSTLRAIALARPASLGELAGVSGIGAKKLDAYGEELLRAVRNSG
jgi:ATP-dependent DNA helicase RecQ